MAKLPWMKFFPADYLLDTQVLTPAARGIWMDLICHLWRSETRGELQYPTAIWEAILRCQDPHLTTIFNELVTHRICTIVTDSHNNVTVQSRRMLREENGRTGARLRKRKQRVTPPCHSDVTPEKLEVRSQKLESEARNQIKKEEKRPLRATVVDVEFFSELKKNPAYAHIDMERENGKMDAWLALPANKHRIKTRKFILNWLNKIETPLQSRSSGTCAYRVKKDSFLKPCGEPAELIGGHYLCAEHRSMKHERPHLAAT